MSDKAYRRSQIEHGAGDPNGIVHAASGGELYVSESGTPALWQSSGPGTVWTQLGSGDGAGSGLPPGGDPGQFVANTAPGEGDWENAPSLQQAPTPRGYDSAFQLQGPPINGGTYTLTFQGETTAEIAWDEDPYTALVALSNIDDADINTYNGSGSAIWYVFFIGALAQQSFDVGTDIDFGTQALTFDGSPVTFGITQWETGAPIPTPTPVAETVVDIDGVLGIPMMWVNVGTVDSPDWRPVRGWYAYGSGLNNADGIVLLAHDGFFVQMNTAGQLISSFFVGQTGTRIESPAFSFNADGPVADNDMSRGDVSLWPEPDGTLLHFKTKALTDGTIRTATVTLS